MQTLPVTKRERSEGPEGPRRLLAVPRPEAGAARPAGQGGGARRLRAQRDHRPAGGAVRLVPGRDRRHGGGDRGSRGRRRPARPDPASQQPGRGEPAPPRAAHRHRDRARERGGAEVLRQGVRRDVQEDPRVRHRPRRGTRLPAAAPLGPHRDPGRGAAPAPLRGSAEHAAHGADPATPDPAPARRREHPPPGARRPPHHPGHHRRPGAAPLARSAAAAHRDGVLQRRPGPPRRGEGMGGVEEEGGRAGRRRPRRAGPSPEATGARGRGGRVRPPSLRRAQAPLADRRRDEGRWTTCRSSAPRRSWSCCSR